MKTAPRFQAIVTKIAAKYSVNLDSPDAYLRLELVGNGYLVLENVGTYRIRVTNYIEVGHNFVADPQVVVYVQRSIDTKQSGPETATWILPMEVTELFGGWRIYAELDADGNIVLYDSENQAQLAEVCDRIYARNLDRFGWLYLARRATTAPKSWELNGDFDRSAPIDNNVAGEADDVPF